MAEVRPGAGRGRGARRVAVSAVLAVLAAMLASCAQIPQTGVPSGIAEVAPVQPASDPGVRVVAAGPQAGDSIYDIVSGFLEASGTVEPGFGTARKYLTSPAAAGWNPGAGILIFDHQKFALAEIDGGRVQLVSPAVGQVDDQGVFLAPQPGNEVVAEFSLTEVQGEWRIDGVPAGLVVSKQDFDREYVAVDTYYLTGEDSSAVLVPDPRYLPKFADLPTRLAGALLRGPSRWLAPAVITAVPPGAALAGPVEVIGDVAKVRLMPGSVPQGVARDNLLGQLVMTLTEAAAVASVEVSVDGEAVTIGGTGPARMDRDDTALPLPADLRPHTPSPYYLRQAVAFAGAPAAQGPFPTNLKLSQIAVSPGGDRAAGIAKNRRTLWTAPIAALDQIEVRLEGAALTSASFDGDGNLWVVAGKNEQTQVYRIPPVGPPVVAKLNGFLAFQVNRLQVASDGARMALVLETRDGPRAYLALVTEAGGAVAVGGLRQVGQELQDPRDIGWSAPDRLTVLGTERGGQPQPFVLSLDGRVVDTITSLADIEEIAAAPRQPMLAGTSKDQIWRLGDGGNWSRVDPGICPGGEVSCTAPAYPG